MIDGWFVGSKVCVEGELLSIGANDSVVTVRFCRSSTNSKVLEQKNLIESYITLTDENRAHLVTTQKMLHELDAVLRVTALLHEQHFRAVLANGTIVSKTFFRRRYRLATADEVAKFVATEKQRKEKEEAEKKERSEEHTSELQSLS
jgi:predicted DCC family thiol-disulfide oxidoreductase YuxK